MGSVPFRHSVFVSATSQGLGKWRDIIGDILHCQKIRPLIQDYFSLESMVIRRQIDDQIEQSSGVVCLVGPYYGTPLEERRPDEKFTRSCTQYEWFRATELRRVSVYLIEDSFFPAGIEPEKYINRPDGGQFAKWQRSFREFVRETGRYYEIKSELDLALALARKDWNAWLAPR